MAFSTGIDRETGKSLSDWPHVVQSMRYIWSTWRGTRVMRRYVGGEVRGLLGRNLDPVTLLRFWTAIVLSIELHLRYQVDQAQEPRFRVRKISYPPLGNTTQDIDQGRLHVSVEGDYMPRALQGDFTVELPTRTIDL